jgi:Mo-dependent nitrogenase C-terminus
MTLNILLSDRHYNPLNTSLHWLKSRLERAEVGNPTLARLLCHLIPAQCPFARTIRLLGRTLFRIPPLCKLNPVYDELMALRFRALVLLEGSTH